MKFVLYFIFFSFLIRFVMRVVFPFFKGVSMMSGRMRQMQDQMNTMQNNAPPAAPVKTTPRKGDYIEFEEVK